MCRPSLQACLDSSRLLVMLGSLLLALAAGLLAWTARASDDILRDLDPAVADQSAPLHYGQLAAAGYLLLLALFGCLAAHYNQKSSIQLLATLTTVNFVCAICLTVYLHHSHQSQPLGPQLAERLAAASRKYNFTDRAGYSLGQAPEPSRLEVMDEAPARFPRQANQSGELVVLAKLTGNASAALEPAEATRIWDRLQVRGCCGFRNATQEWGRKLPKSCCNQPLPSLKDSGELLCAAVDTAHSRACAELLESSYMDMLSVLVLAALANLFVASVTSITAYRTYQYSEASQTAH